MLKLVHFRHQNGFSLLELMITLVIAGILVSTAIPGYRVLVENDRLSAESNKIVGAISLARNEASRRGESVSICPVTNPNEDNLECGQTEDWSQWKALISNGGELLGIVEPVTNTTIQYLDSEGTPLDRLTISTTGRIRSPGEFILCESLNTRIVNINQAGHSTVTKNSVNQCEEEE